MKTFFGLVAMLPVNVDLFEFYVSAVGLFSLCVKVQLCSLLMNSSLLLIEASTC